MKKMLFLLSISFSFFKLPAAIIFWDLQGTLVQVKTWEIIKACTTPRVAYDFFSFKLAHPFSNYKTATMQHFFSALNNIPYSPKTTYNIFADDGVSILPPILRDMTTGQLPTKTAQKICSQWFAGNAQSYYSLHERIIFDRMLSFCMSPTALIEACETTTLVSLLKEVTQQVDGDGNKKHINIILSNWTKEAMQPFKDRFKTTILAFIDDEVFSAAIGFAKPDQSIYDYCYDLICTKFPSHLNEPFFFVDDQDVNLKGAQQNKKHSFVCTLPSHAHAIFKRYKII